MPVSNYLWVGAVQPDGRWVGAVSPDATPAVTTYDQFGFRWYADDGSESASTPLAGQNVNISRAKNTPTRLRIGTNRTN